MDMDIARDNGSNYVPVANRKATLYGVTITLQVVASLAVILRLYTRLRVFKKPGWDDATIALAFGATTVGSVFILISIPWGLGQHVYDLKSPAEFSGYLRRFYGANGAYMLATPLIKISLLLQYLRVYQSGTMRKICIGFICFISLWGLTYNFMAWFPCFPVKAFWDWTMPPSEYTCYAFGAKLKGPFIAAYVSHAAANLILDLSVLLCCLPLIWRNDRSRREFIALFGLLAVGTWIIVVSAWRLGTIISHGAGWGGPNGEAMDFTFYAPVSILLSASEVGTAIFAASMPIFWPIMEAKWFGVFVTQEVVVHTERRADEQGLELERSSTHSGDGSERGLNRSATRTEQYYRSAHLQGYLDPFKTHEDVNVAEAAHYPPQKGSRYETLEIEYK